MELAGAHSHRLSAVHCPDCGTENPEQAKFCFECASPLVTPAAERGAERKVVSILFCDLVDYTNISHAVDPEDVDASLRRYHAEARRIVESVGGVVEKFIGDAVCAVFGVPAAHEDDPERAIRAALRISDAMPDVPPVLDHPWQVRCGITTGEALVRLDVDPARGEGFITGDTVNVAARLQAVAPAGRVVVDDRTFDVARRRFSFETLEPVSLKGKPEPVALHLVAVGPSEGVDVAGHVAPFTGRAAELQRLVGAFEDARRRSSMAAATILGEAGLGKTRLVAEFATPLSGEGVRVLWGGCLPYGEGVGFWALGEVVKAHAGIRDSDPPPVALERLGRGLHDAPDRRWLIQRLSPLLGIESDGAVGRDELYAAWRRYLELIGEAQPCVIVFEDLHWADDAFLTFLVHLQEQPIAAPILVIGTARPELAERDPDLLAGADHVRIDLKPLTREQIASVFAFGLAGSAVGGSLDPIVDRVGGNPLFAREFARLIGERAARDPSAGIELPSSVHAVIAARIDALEPDRKAVVADASVVGGTFWSGAVAAVSGKTQDEVMASLRDLASRNLIEAVARSSFEGDQEYAFSHILVRDVAYGQIPRAARAAKHAAIVSWIEERTGDRVDDFAEVLAHHAVTAVDLARAAGQHELQRSVVPAAVRFLTMAGERALGLDTQAAMSHLDRAMVLVDPDDPQRSRVLLAFARAALDAGSPVEASKAAEESAFIARSHGDPTTASAAYSVASALHWRNDHAEGERLAEEAVAVLAEFPLSIAYAEALGRLAGLRSHANDPIGSMALAERAIAIADALGEDPPASALMARGNARCREGDPDGVADQLRVPEVALARGDGRGAANGLNNAANDVLVFHGPRAALDVLDRGLSLAVPRGLRDAEGSLRETRLEVWLELGDTRSVVEEATELAHLGEEPENLWGLTGVRTQLLRALVVMGRADRAAGWLEWLETESRVSGTAEDVSGLAAVAAARAQIGRSDRAGELLLEADALPNDAYLRAVYQGLMLRTAVEIERPELAERLVERFVVLNLYGEHARVASIAALAEMQGRTDDAIAAYADAASAWDAFGVVPESAWAWLGLGRCQASRSADPAAALSAARARFVTMEASSAIHRCDELLGSPR